MRIERFSQALLRPDARALERAFSRAMITEGGKTGTASANITLELLDSEGQLVALLVQRLLAGANHGAAFVN